ncbi:hypothetical protein L6452_05389 [Arctium lappa]|uniref:Uncharacterized protein n=1 Tax=Arctium lappa TaxID=4217 RepID=A0ACB9EGG3_ARCLA|nr:hypothetical protein L6452_05389 [Arctium lappa]
MRFEGFNKICSWSPSLKKRRVKTVVVVEVAAAAAEARSCFMSRRGTEEWKFSVSSYCKRHGVNRGPVQFRKRWSNLAGDFKKIKEWESKIKKEVESFSLMRNDLRRERKLPGFFDREVDDILDGGGADKSLVLSLAPSQDDT